MTGYNNLLRQVYNVYDGWYRIDFHVFTQVCVGGKNNDTFSILNQAEESRVEGIFSLVNTQQIHRLSQTVTKPSFIKRKKWSIINKEILHDYIC